ncbi:hypothetical protein Pcinc_009276 [Petrolisthes cinctipes]|uniref:Uncharacterized protein n=1 Tax=Petrolisthes cinctipes TaxID=88211 RepID=A0AAE1KVR0_PETCI|nr:hypothetical protein Pcinc_009276 [Petrolisthes cinctipes]
MARQYYVQCMGKKKIIKAEEKQQVPSAIIKEFVLNQESYLYVFNLAFPKNMISSLTFLQKVVLGHCDNSKKDVKVINLLTKINRLMVN